MAKPELFDVDRQLDLWDFFAQPFALIGVKGGR